jgi:hypothetical protein
LFHVVGNDLRSETKKNNCGGGTSLSLAPPVAAPGSAWQPNKLADSISCKALPLAKYPMAIWLRSFQSGCFPFFFLNPLEGKI